MRVTSVRSYVEIDNKNYTMLELLDALKDFKIIPDIDKAGAIKNLRKRMSEIGDMEKFIKLILKYPPRVRAFSGALLELIGYRESLTLLKDSLNPLSDFEIGLDIQQLPTSQNWKIK